MNTQNLLETLRHIVGAKYVITDPSKTERYRTGYRFGTGNAIAVVRPATLWEQWQVLEACVEADVIVISQAANTGITGGSNPFGNDYDRDVVIINTMRNDNIQLINEGKQAVCLTGATLNHLEQELKVYDREPHSVIGSSCIGASVIGGVCNNSGGSLVQRGPAYTEMALFAQRNADGKLELINHLGIDLGSSPKEILTNLQEGKYQQKDIHSTDKKGHDHDYCNHVREINANTPARFNADPARLFEASGSAGRLGVFAVRVDTFPAEKKTAVFYIGTNNTAVLTKLRRDMLGTFEEIPISGEYIHRTAFDIAAKYGKDTFWYIKNVGTEYLPKLFSLKAWGDRVAKKLPFMPNHFSEKFLQFTSKLMPQHLPKILWDYRNQYEHHLILKMGGKGVDEARAYLQKEFADSTKGAFIECDAKLAQAAMLLRFAVASAAIRYRSVHEDEVEDIVALDIALRRNDEDWFEKLPPELDAKILHKLYYGHFMCHVFHQDYVIKKGYNCEEIEEEMLKILDTRGAQYPAEHNVGHLYHANDDLKKFYNSLDPTNSFNPGIGKTSKKKDWK
ncbi:D-lactate dehydrogenase [Capnocytophaga genosp. AHN8471]|uniref:Quinone-dependent D-lactate dehydrogenase n=2 Tax=Capnocytophaga TaxID=1016 RepID=A0ABS1YWT9_9FLAO|nr:D-lactate dehydrogenase [Capnocytophaga genosp. AHN8471]MBM0650493.1 D-lactate dehydrogenase [Capnocytophaga genosp. AHN8471]MBM0656469.1 D-lactate dehydrogenase [Capnocytophaga genosp. AHN8471]MBM0660514.1 D-lactate dehydrogenase [Capnocytophaga genosp. AHN8471]MBM0662974.1 D-lactate dehydrogenase [Capnocytophaga genosp. AHN8471]